jgi:hypothetical protein
LIANAAIGVSLNQRLTKRRRISMKIVSGLSALVFVAAVGCGKDSKKNDAAPVADSVVALGSEQKGTELTQEQEIKGSEQEQLMKEEIKGEEKGQEFKGEEKGQEQGKLIEEGQKGQEQEIPQQQQEQEQAQEEQGKEEVEQGKEEVVEQGKEQVQEVQQAEQTAEQKFEEQGKEELSKEEFSQQVEEQIAPMEQTLKNEVEPKVHTAKGEEQSQLAQTAQDLNVRFTNVRTDLEHVESMSNAEFADFVTRIRAELAELDAIIRGLIAAR